VVGQTPLKAGLALDVEAPGVAEAAQPGQFGTCACPGRNRPRCAARSASMARRGRSSSCFTDRRSRHRPDNRLAPGDPMQVIGPLGNGFPLAPQGTPLLGPAGTGMRALLLCRNACPTRLSRSYATHADDVLAVADFVTLGCRCRGDSGRSLGELSWLRCR
jgi:hypothetical protein